MRPQNKRYLLSQCGLWVSPESLHGIIRPCIPVYYVIFKNINTLLCWYVFVSVGIINFFKNFFFLWKISNIYISRNNIMNPHSHHTLTITNSCTIIYTPPSTPPLVYFKANLKYGYHFVNALVYISKYKDFKKNHMLKYLIIICLNIKSQCSYFLNS